MKGSENGEKTRNFYGGTPRWKRLRERICWWISGYTTVTAVGFSGYAHP